MSAPVTPSAASGRAWTKRNLLVLAAGLVCLGAGYGVLAAGQASAAAVLLVVGYCVLLPLAIIL